MGKRARVTVRAENLGAFAELARDLRRAGAKSLQRELYAGLQRSARPAIQAARESAEANLPSGRGAYQGGGGRRRKRKRGRRAAREGLGVRVANATYRPKVSQRSGLVKLTVTATEKPSKPIDVEALDRGRLRHPLFGNRRHWHGQTVAQGWFTRPMQAQAPNVDRELGRAVDAVVREISGS